MNYPNPITPEKITDLNSDEIFVFGSNESGIHGAGAALQAVNNFGAVHGVGFGHKGQSYAIPTKDFYVNTLDLSYIKVYVSLFIKEVEADTLGYQYLVTEVGCGLAGYNPEDIAPFFKNVMGNPNVSLPQSFQDILITL
jgi:hypothetical protein